MGGDSRHINNKGRKITVGLLSQQITNLFSESPRKKYNARMVIEKLKIANSKDSVFFTLTNLSKKNVLLSHDEDFFQWNPAAIIQEKNASPKSKQTTASKVIVGRVDLTRQGSAFIIVDDSDTDVFVPERNVNGAMDRDIVKVELLKKSSGKRPEGKIVEITKRSLSHVLGTINILNKFAFVYPDASKRFPDVYVHLKNLGEAIEGDKVVVEITEWGQGQNKSIWGKVTSVLKNVSPHEMAMQSILIEAGFETEFPVDVLKEAANISTVIPESEILIRRDFREVLTFTIDPETARDFDDAISYEVLENGHIEIGVHIADVSHYLQENTALDKEGYLRSTSVYLVDRCVPMLPEKLSNDLCSLNPNEDKLTFSAVFEFNEKNKIVKEWFGKTIIHSDRRFTYEEAQERLESGEGDLADELKKCNVIAYQLRKEKFKNGAINFESDEVRFVLDEDNKPISVYVKERKDAHMLIEDFMLLANKSVAKYIAKKAIPVIPFVYRIHDMPDPTKLADFALFAKELGVKLMIDTPENIATSLNSLNSSIAKDASLKILSPLAIRTMAKAEYNTKNIGHYGLAFEHYTHFTSPIRRYSDVLVHRILFENLKTKVKRVDLDALSQKCKHISKQEIKASEAERESVKYKQVEFMKDQIGKIFEGQVNGMIDKGFFVQILENKAEGMVPFSSIEGNYKMQENRLKAISSTTRHEIVMGDIIKVKLIDADMLARKLEFELIE
jgi:ribonuclease R